MSMVFKPHYLKITRSRHGLPRGRLHRPILPPKVCGAVMKVLEVVAKI